MRRATFSLFVLLLSLCITSFGQTPQWKVVKEFHLTNSTLTIPQTGFLDAPANGVYRLSGYMAALSNTAQNTSWFAEVIWTDRSGAETNTGMAPGLNSGSSSQTIPAQIICPQPGTQISLYILPSNPPPQDATYDIVLTLEKLTD